MQTRSLLSFRNARSCYFSRLGTLLFLRLSVVSCLLSSLNGRAFLLCVSRCFGIPVWHIPSSVSCLRRPSSLFAQAFALE